MKKQIWKVVTFLAALVAASSAAAQTNHGEIPFAFSAANLAQERAESLRIV